MKKKEQSPARQAREKRTRVRRNAYRDVAIEYYARNSSSVLAITHRHWPDQPWSSQPELARILSAELGWELDYRSLNRQLRWVHRFDHSVRQRIFEILWQMEFNKSDKSSNFVAKSDDYGKEDEYC